MAQLEARLDGIEEVRGSNPLGSTNLNGLYVYILQSQAIGRYHVGRDEALATSSSLLAFTLGEMNLLPLFNYLRPIWPS